jgi:hypothetical protein
MVNRELRSPVDEGSTRHVEFEIQGGPAVGEKKKE